MIIKTDAKFFRSILFPFTCCCQRWWRWNVVIITPVWYCRWWLCRWCRYVFDRNWSTEFLLSVII